MFIYMCVCVIFFSSSEEGIVIHYLSFSVCPDAHSLKFKSGLSPLPNFYYFLAFLGEYKWKRAVVTPMKARTLDAEQS